MIVTTKNDDYNKNDDDNNEDNNNNKINEQKKIENQKHITSALEKFSYIFNNHFTQTAPLRRAEIQPIFL